MRAQGATRCYGCKCDTCANSVELPFWYVTIGEASEACFSCDECRHYDGDFGKRDQWRETCPRYIEAAKVIEIRERAAQNMEKRRAQEADEQAKRLRATFKVIKCDGGGDDHV